MRRNFDKLYKVFVRGKGYNFYAKYFETSSRPENNVWNKNMWKIVKEDIKQCDTRIVQNKAGKVI